MNKIILRQLILLRDGLYCGDKELIERNAYYEIPCGVATIEEVIRKVDEFLNMNPDWLRREVLVSWNNN